jgi:hypothetical protein
MGVLKVKNNFLSKEIFSKIKKEFFEHFNFPWYYLKHQVSKKDKPFFSHCFFQEEKINSPFYYKIINPIIDKLSAKKLYLIRANLILKNEKSLVSAFHTDLNFKCKTAIYYVNSNNGGTLFKTNKEEMEIKSEENKIVMFDSQILHAAKSQTDTDTRIVININYE